MRCGKSKEGRTEKKRHSLRMRMLSINMSITVISFILYGFLFIMSINLLVGKYMNNDLDFFLTEVSDNLEIKMEYVKDSVSKIRTSQVLMNYIGNDDYGMDKELLYEEFRELVNINSSQNKGKDGEPMVDKVYLFTKEGDFISDCYYALLASEIAESDEIVKNVRDVFLKARSDKIGFTTYYYNHEDRLYLACPVLDKRMDEQGGMIFEIRTETIKKIMQDLERYEDSFWTIRTVKGTVIEESMGSRPVSSETLKDTGHSKPATVEIEGKSYRLYNKELCMDVRILLGIPEDYAIQILYDSLDIYVLGILGILAVGLIGFGIFTYKMTKPIEEVGHKLKQVQEGDFETKLKDYDSKEFHEISKGFNQMTTEINHLINEVYEKQILEKEMELKFFQAQMNPHFMFNVLNVIALQAKIDGNEQISKSISNFSQLIQSKIYRSDTEKVRIKQELEYVKFYLEIQEFRYGKGLSYSIEVDEKLLDCYIPKLCIQMVVENAVVHGIEPKMGGGHVQISVAEEFGNIQMKIIDDGVGFDTTGQMILPLKAGPANKTHNQVGLNNVNSIIKLMYGKEYGVTIYSETGKGTTVAICIPLDKEA